MTARLLYALDVYSASRCPHHTQADYDAARIAREEGRA